MNESRCHYIFMRLLAYVWHTFCVDFSEFEGELIIFAGLEDSKDICKVIY